MGLAVVTVASGGLPIVESTVGGTPVTEATNGRGVPVTKVVGKPGLPVVFETIGAGGGAAAPPLDDVEVDVVGGYSASRKLLTSFGAGAKVLESGGVVQSFFNQKTGGSAALSQSTVAYRPTLTTAGPNGVACLNFDGTDDCLFSPGGAGGTLADYISAATGLIVISFIADVIDASNITVYANEGLMGDSGGFMGLFTKTPDAIHLYNYDGTIDTVSTPITEGVPYVAEWRHEGGIAYVRINGGTEVNVASGNTSGLAGLLGIGGTSVVPVAATSFDGKIFELATFKTVPNLTKRNTLVANMMAHIGAT